MASVVETQPVRPALHPALRHDSFHRQSHPSQPIPRFGEFPLPPELKLARPFGADAHNLGEAIWNWIADLFQDPEHALHEKWAKATANNFESEVIDASYDHDVLVLFENRGPFQYPDKLMKYVLTYMVTDTASEERPLKRVSINTATQRELAERFNIVAVPTLMFFKNGKAVERPLFGDRTTDQLVAYQPRPKLQEIFQEWGVPLDVDHESHFILNW